MPNPAWMDAPEASAQPEWMNAPEAAPHAAEPAPGDRAAFATWAPGVPKPALPNAEARLGHDPQSEVLLNWVGEPAPLSTPTNPVENYVQGVHNRFNAVIPNLAAGRKSAAAANALEGVGGIVAPAALPFAWEAPLTTAVATAAGSIPSLMRSAKEPDANESQASQDRWRLGSDAADLAAGLAGGKFTDMAGRAVAEGAMNSSVGAGMRAKNFGARPGYAALTETSGFKPGTMQESAVRRIQDINAPYEAHIAQAPPVDLGIPRSIMDAVIRSTRNPETIAGATPARESLYGNRVTGTPYGPTMPASEALDVKRELGDIINWNPQERTSAANAGGQRAYGALSDIIHAAAPGTSEMAGRMHNLIPFAQRAKMADLAAGPVETGFNRAARPTGGLLPTLLAGHEFGPLGAVGTLAAQEALASPTAKAAIARALWRGVGGERLGVPEMPQRQIAAGGPASGPMYNWRNSPMVPGAQLALPPASSGIGVSGTIVPDILGTSTRGQGTPRPLLEAGPQPPVGGPLEMPPIPDRSAVHGVPAHEPFRVGFSANATRQLAAPERGNAPLNILPRGAPGAEHAIGPAGPVPIHSTETPIPGTSIPGSDVIRNPFTLTQQERANPILNRVGGRVPAPHPLIGKNVEWTPERRSDITMGGKVESMDADGNLVIRAPNGSTFYRPPEKVRATGGVTGSAADIQNPFEGRRITPQPVRGEADWETERQAITAAEKAASISPAQLAEAYRIIDERGPAFQGMRDRADIVKDRMSRRGGPDKESIRELLTAFPPSLAARIMNVK